MAQEKRKEIIAALEAERRSKVLVYVTGDRPSGGLGINLQLNVESTVVPFIYEALRDIGQTDAIDLFLYTRGGAVDVDGGYGIHRPDLVFGWVRVGEAGA